MCDIMKEYNLFTFRRTLHLTNRQKTILGGKAKLCVEL